MTQATKQPELAEVPEQAPAAQPAADQQAAPEQARSNVTVIDPSADRGWRLARAGELGKPFGEDEIRWRAGAVVDADGRTAKREGGRYPQGCRAQKLPYIDARQVEQRLDNTLGPTRWQDIYRVIDDRNLAVECGIGIQQGDGSWVWKYDVGYPNSGEDAEHADREPLKAAYSDAFKRAAVKWGIGRHLYQMPRVWAPIDERGRWLKEQ